MKQQEGEMEQQEGEMEQVIPTLSFCRQVASASHPVQPFPLTWS